MKIVYDDIIYSLQGSGGISLYWSLLEKYIKPEIRLLYTGCTKNIFFSHIENKIIKNKHILLERYKNITLPEKQPFVFHSSYYRYCKNRNAINITTVHDFIYEYFRYDIKSSLHKKQKENAINHSDGIIAISESTKKDIAKFFPRYNRPIKVIYHGVSKEFFSMAISKKNTVIFIGGRAGYKNFIYVVDILRKLPELLLQIIGGGQLSQKEQSILDDYIPNRYEYYPFLSNMDLNIKYNEAFFLLYPSLYEGFGFPVVEAQAAGCPVVCCNVSSLPEVAGKAAIYISGKNIDADLEQIKQLNNQAYYTLLLEKGFENSKKFSWEKCAEETYSFYKEIIIGSKIITPPPPPPVMYLSLDN